MAATATIAQTADARDARAAELFANWTDWQRGRTHAGRAFFAIPGAEANTFHAADQNDCSCPDRQKRGATCKHVRAVRLWMAAYRSGAVEPKRPFPRGRTLATGAARPSYGDLVKSCRAYPCSDDPERGGYCYRHQGVRCGVEGCRRVRVAPDLSCEDHETADVPGLVDAF